MQKQRVVTVGDMPESDQFIIVNPEEIGKYIKTKENLIVQEKNTWNINVIRR